VSTKIPFKGTGKEYIGDDITEIASAVKVWSAFSLQIFNFSNEVFSLQIFIFSNVKQANSNFFLLLFPVCPSTMLYPIKIQDYEKDTGPWAAGEETKSKQVGIS